MFSGLNKDEKKFITDLYYENEDIDADEDQYDNKTDEVKYFYKYYKGLNAKDKKKCKNILKEHECFEFEE